MDRCQRRLAEAEALAKEARWQEAAEAYRLAVGAGATGFQTHVSYGTALLHCGALEAAKAPLKAALDMSPDSLDALNNLGAKLGRVFRNACNHREKTGGVLFEMVYSLDEAA